MLRLLLFGSNCWIINTLLIHWHANQWQGILQLSRHLSHFLYSHYVLLLPPPHKNKTTTTTTTIKTKAIRYLYPDRHKDRQTLTAYSLFRSLRLQLALYDRSTQFLKCNLSTGISIFPSLLENAVTEHIFAKKKKWTVRHNFGKFWQIN